MFKFKQFTKKYGKQIYFTIAPLLIAFYHFYLAVNADFKAIMLDTLSIITGLCIMFFVGLFLLSEEKNEVDTIANS